MKRILLALVLALSFAAPVFATTSNDLAPADRYFGRLKMSILGIRNSIKDLLVEDALRDWQAKFPRDPWIPKFTFSLAQLYAKLDLDDARTRRDDMLDWLDATYPDSEFAGQPRE